MPGPTLLSIVIPAWNEAATIFEVVAETRAALRLLPEGAFHVLVVDNGSTDDTADRARQAGAVVIAEPSRGYGRACLTGIAASPPSDVVVFMDGDGSDNPSEIPSLIEPILRGDADLVIGSRELGVSEKGAHPWHAVAGTRLCVALMNLLVGTKATDLGPFRAIRASALAGLGMEDATFGWTTEMQIKAHHAVLRVMEVPVNYRCRRGGESKISGSWRASVRAGSRILGMIVQRAFIPAVIESSRKLTDGGLRDGETYATTALRVGCSEKSIQRYLASIGGLQSRGSRVFDGPSWEDADGGGGLRSHSGAEMQNYSFVVERDADTGLYVGHIPGWPGAHSQGATLDELQGNLQEVIAMLLEDGAPKFESEFVGVQTIKVA